MATSKRGIRSTRKLRDWTVEQVESGKFQGLVWDDPPAKTMFRIPWKHAGKQEFRQEEDAGFFKAWAIYKGKYIPGECNPATWKTRVRCALSKSPEFEEVPSRSRLDVSEPYKVYRLVPFLEQVTGNKVKRQNTKQVKMDDSGSPEAASPREERKPPANSLLLLESAETPTPEVMASQLFNGFNLPNCQNREVSPQAAEPAPEMNEMIAVSLETDLSPLMGAATRPIEDFSLCVSISYAGEPPCRYLLPEGEYLFTSVAESLNGPNCLKRFVLTAPVTMADELKQKIVQRRLKDLVKGIMVASNHGGIFILCRDKVHVSWSGFLAPEGQIKLENNTHQQLFKSREFRSALELYQEGLGPLPDPRVILYVGNDLDENGDVDCKPIIIQMEQTFAIRMHSSGCFP
ncbi:interferon regulatory factor 9 [Pseudonaja textilis]|uniref:interferon regulatory factor 9 n=1 Tax=Pseudonaja textilis TaxID=8673 RepID=UPI000EA92BB4|nr:interferon regulatory factor 9 [Pseudonaja textilis]